MEYTSWSVISKYLMVMAGRGTLETSVKDFKTYSKLCTLDIFNEYSVSCSCKCYLTIRL